MRLCYDRRTSVAVEGKKGKENILIIGFFLFYVKFGKIFSSFFQLFNSTHEGWVRCVHNLLFFGYEIDTHRNTACFRKEGRGMRKIRHNSSAKKENSNFFHHEKVSRAQRNTKSSSHTISILSFFSSHRRLRKTREIHEKFIIEANFYTNLA